MRFSRSPVTALLRAYSSAAPKQSTGTSAKAAAATVPAAVKLDEEQRKIFRFTREHEWACITPDGLITVGISSHAAKALGDVVFVEVPKEGSKIKAGDSIGAVESVKAASELYSPVSGTIWATNHLLEKKPQVIGTHPYCSGWFCKIKFTDETELAKMMTWKEYDTFTGGEEN